MSKKQIGKFAPAVREKIGYYVYLLIHPDTKEPFYVGKGKGNRVFQSSSNSKLPTLRKIKAKGLLPQQIILRHQLTEDEALEVEAAVIDAIGIDKLDNRVLGQKSDERGRMSVREVIAEYDAPKIKIKEPSILIIVNQAYYRGISEAELYEITRKHWVVSPTKHNAKYAFSIFNGIVRQVYEIDKWIPSKIRRGRWMFEGKVANDMQHYINGSVSKYVVQGAQNPIKYVKC